MNASQQTSAKAISIELAPGELVKLEKAAALKNMTIQEYLVFLVEVSTHQA